MSFNIDQKNILTHCVAFCAGALITFMIVDSASKGDSPKERVRSKIRPQVKKYSDKDKMKIMMGSMGNVLSKSFDHMSQFPGANIKVEEIRENNEHVVYLKGEGIDLETLKIDISSGQLFMSGRIDKESKTASGFSKVVSSFSRTIALPSDIRQSNPKIESIENGIKIRFKLN